MYRLSLLGPLASVLQPEIKVNRDPAAENQVPSPKPSLHPSHVRSCEFGQEGARRVKNEAWPTGPPESLALPPTPTPVVGNLNHKALRKVGEAFMSGIKPRGILKGLGTWRWDMVCCPFSIPAPLHMQARDSPAPPKYSESKSGSTESESRQEGCGSTLNQWSKIWSLQSRVQGLKAWRPAKLSNWQHWPGRPMGTLGLPSRNVAFRTPEDSEV